MSFARPSGFLISIVAGLLVALLAEGAVRPAAAQGASFDRESQGSIRQIGRLGVEEGWALTDTALLFTNDGGESWSDLASGLQIADITDTFLLSASQAQLAGVRPDSPQMLTVLDTVNGGTSWRERFIEESELVSGQIYEGARIHFLDSAHGWLLGQVATSSAFSVAELYRTTDGGETWERLPRPPAAGRFVFVDPLRGYMTGAPVSERLYRTFDGGRTWKEAEMVLPVKQGMALFALPTFHSNKLGTLAITLRGVSPRVLAFATRDGGESWALAASRALPPGDYDEPVAIALDQDGSVLALGAQDTVELAQGRTPRAHSLIQRTFEGMQSGGDRAVSIRTLAFAGDDSVWFLVAEGGCEEGLCRQSTRLVAVDGSSPNTGPGNELMVRARVEPWLGEKSQRVSDGAIISHDMGFDKCAAGTTAQMQAWWDNSPYKDANIYFGGSARACSQINLDASWVATVFDQGWRLIPTWVGPQAPCTNFSRRFSSDPAGARTDGFAEADAAIAAAAALDLGSGTPLYYDVEYYDETDESCSAAVSAFINAWSERLKDHGYLAGAYGNARNVQNDWIPGVIANPPDAVWLTPWVCGSGRTSCDWTPSVFGVPGLDDSYWADDQRIRQYWGPHTQTYGGVTFEIDGDFAGGPVAAAGIASSCWEVIPEGHWQGEYFDNRNLSGSAVMVRDEGGGAIDFDWDSGSPGQSCGVPADDFSARWTRTEHFDGGTYRFTVTADDGVRLFIDGAPEIDEWRAQPSSIHTATVALRTGNHAIRLDYFDSTGSSTVKLSWERLATFLRAAPDSRVRPAD